MKPGIAAGAVAGAVGTLALDTVSYSDMLVRGRPASALPGEAATRLAGMIGVRLGAPGSDTRSNRASALGAVLGYATGVAIGAAYARVAPRRGGVRTGLALGAAAMVATNAPMVVQGLTDPRTWGLAGWMSDILPHVAYGLAADATYRAITAS